MRGTALLPQLPWRDHSFVRRASRSGQPGERCSRVPLDVPPEVALRVPPEAARNMPRRRRTSPIHLCNGIGTLRDEGLSVQVTSVMERESHVGWSGWFGWFCRRRGPRAADLAAESRHGRRAEPCDDHQVRPADAGDHLPVAAAHAAVGAGPGRHLPGEPPTELLRGRRPRDVRADRRPGGGHPRRTRRAAGPAGLRRRGGARGAGEPLRAAGVRGRRGARRSRLGRRPDLSAGTRPGGTDRHRAVRRRGGPRRPRRRRVLRRPDAPRRGGLLGVHGPCRDRLYRRSC